MTYIWVVMAEIGVDWDGVWGVWGEMMHENGWEHLAFMRTRMERNFWEQVDCHGESLLLKGDQSHHQQQHLKTYPSEEY